MQRFAISILLLLMSAGICLFGQDTATISGTVTDQSGASIPGAEVVLVNVATQFTRTVETNGNGQYVAPAIPIGEYVITATKAGFQTLRRSGIQLTAASTLSVDLKLELGSQTQTVSVAATAP